MANLLRQLVQCIDCAMYGIAYTCGSVAVHVCSLQLIILLRYLVATEGYIGYINLNPIPSQHTATTCKIEVARQETGLAIASEDITTHLQFNNRLLYYNNLADGSFSMHINFKKRSEISV
jgi:hypothetical protein